MCALTVVALIWINYKVVKIVKGNDLPLVMMLICLKLSLISFAIFFGFSSSINQYYVCYGRYYYCMMGTFANWPAVFLGLAALFNLNKWIYFIIFVRHLKKEINETFELNLKRKQWYLNLLTFLIATAIIISQSVFTVRACDGTFTLDV